MLVYRQALYYLRCSEYHFTATTYLDNHTIDFEHCTSDIEDIARSIGQFYPIIEFKGDNISIQTITHPDSIQNNTSEKYRNPVLTS